MIRIGILGAGALGSLLAYNLSSRTPDGVWLLARSPMPPAVTLSGVGTVPVRVSHAPAEPVDVLLVAVKAYATADALAWAAGAIGPNTIALTLQNGLGNAETLAALLGPGRVLAGTTAQGATLLGPGKVAHGGTGPTNIAPWTPFGPAAERLPAIADLLRGAGFPTTIHPDPRPLLWAKLAINCGINALTAILRVPNGALLERESTRRLMAAAAAEAGAVAAASGVLLPDDPVARVMQVAQATAANRSSMLQDVERGRRTEVDAINGAVAERGQRLGVPTSVNQTLTELVRSM